MSGAYHPNVALGFISYRAYRSRNATAGPGWRIQGRDTNDTIRGPRETSTIQTHPKMRFGEILVKVHAVVFPISLNQLFLSQESFSAGVKSLEHLLKFLALTDLHEVLDQVAKRVLLQLVPCAELG